MKKQPFSVRTLTFCALLSAMALGLSYLESLFPLPVPLPGARLGLGNALVLLAMLLLGPREAAAVLAAKIFLSALLFGSPVSLFYSAVGSFLSYLTMRLLLDRRGISPVGQSAAGAVAHALGQVVTAVLLTGTPRLLLYFTPLGLLSLLTGSLSGTLALFTARLLRRALPYLERQGS